MSEVKKVTNKENYERRDFGTSERRKDQWKEQK